ncbi:angiotensin-converting enzyme-like [Acanthaster planci]|uniref:Angiotensin-converting enzyme n=1 Tax=Acanthaster planci TaxID=133434 RepID=A0A8B7Y3K2_ACAPL|nr:angiotensin-converting enzyme-like [Acanthaster planci]
MWSFALLCMVCMPVLSTAQGGHGHQELVADLAQAREFLDAYSETITELDYQATLAAWEFASNISDVNQQKQIEESLVLAAFVKEAGQNASRFDDSAFPDDVRRRLKNIRDIGTAILEPTKVAEFSELVSSMTDNYSTARVCRPGKPDECLQLEPGLTQVMASSRDWDELVWAWKGFRDKAGVPNKPLYARYVELSNEAARANGYPDTGSYWRSYYEVDDLVAQAYKLYNDILPLYKQLHAYVRRIMHKTHGDKVDVDGRIPSNLLGDMWGRFWGNIYKQVIPYPDTPDIDVTNTMIAKGFTPLRMFQLADDFFASCGLKRVNERFWNNSILEKPTDGRQIVCHPSAWDLGKYQDFRIKMCTEVNMEYFNIVHHEMGHVQYYLQYANLPPSFRAGANRAFHEAVGEVITLSVATPTHLSHPDIGLLNATMGGVDNQETDINFLLKTSLVTIGTLPFSLALEQWRWDVFAGDVEMDKWNERWWQLKHDLVGVRAPVKRTEQDFEAGAMFHIIIDYSFLRYFIRTVIQFQFHKGLCDAAGHTGPLHRCDIYKSTAAGERLANMLKLGSSKPWPDAMEAITGQRSMSADAINEYFAPLMTWLEETNRKNGETIGWDSGGTVPGISLTVLLACMLTTTYAVSTSLFTA